MRTVIFLSVVVMSGGHQRAVQDECHEEEKVIDVSQTSKKQPKRMTDRWPDEVSHVQFVMELRDGSVLVGTPSNPDELALKATFGNVHIPFGQIESVQLQCDLEAATVRLRNGDRLRGFLEFDKVRLKTLLGPLTVPLAELTRWTIRPQPGRYVAMLGIYADARGSGTALPLINLNVPNADNVLNAEILNRMRETVDVQPYYLTLRATGNILLSETGEYRIELGRACYVAIDGRKYALDNYAKRSSRVFRFAQGKHKIDFWVGNNGGQLNEAFLEITEAETGKSIPVFCTEKEISEFQKTPIGDTLPAEVHDWERTRLVRD